MQTKKTLSLSQNNQCQRPFSLPIYLLLVFGLSWPFQVGYALWGKTPLLSYLLSSLAMVMVTVATLIAGRFIFRDGFANAGWRWGKPKQYGIAFALALFIFLIPTLLEFVFRLRSQPVEISIAAGLGSFAGYLLITLIPGFGEEFGRRAYLLPLLRPDARLFGGSARKR
jgi:uncharacterized protein